MNKYNSRQKYGMGWFNESHRHSLARMGIKTGRKVNYLKVGDWVRMLDMKKKGRIINMDENTVTIKMRDSIHTVCKDEIDYSKRLVGESDFVWKLPDGSWKWEAMKYEGNGIFYGKVTSPIVPDGEYGTWYIWDVEQNGGVLIQGNPKTYQEIKKTSQKAQQLQKSVLGWAKKTYYKKRPELNKNQLEMLSKIDDTYLHYGHGEREKRMFLNQVVKIKGITR